MFCTVSHARRKNNYNIEDISYRCVGGLSNEVSPSTYGWPHLNVTSRLRPAVVLTSFLLGTLNIRLERIDVVVALNNAKR
jgi:hypothetical protein